MLFSRPLQIVTLSTQIDTIKSLFAISYVAFFRIFIYFFLFLYSVYLFFFKFIFVSSLFLLSQLFFSAIFFSCINFRYFFFFLVIFWCSPTYSRMTPLLSSYNFFFSLLIVNYSFFFSFILYFFTYFSLSSFIFSLFLLFLLFFYIRFLSSSFILYFFCFHSSFILPYFYFFFIQIIIFFLDIFLLVPSFHNINIQSSSFKNPAQYNISCFFSLIIFHFGIIHPLFHTFFQPYFLPPFCFFSFLSKRSGLVFPFLLNLHLVKSLKPTTQRHGIHCSWRLEWIAWTTITPVSRQTTNQTIKLKNGRLSACHFELIVCLRLAYSLCFFPLPNATEDFQKNICPFFASMGSVFLLHVSSYFLSNDSWKHLKCLRMRTSELFFSSWFWHLFQVIFAHHVFSFPFLFYFFYIVVSTRDVWFPFQFFKWIKKWGGKKRRRYQKLLSNSTDDFFFI